MTLLSSGKHSSLGDPRPWAYRREATDEIGPFGHPERAARRVDAAMMWYPRPEYERPLTNPKNIVLEIWRGLDAAEQEQFADELDRLVEDPIMTEILTKPEYEIHIRHAQKVLSRARSLR